MQQHTHPQLDSTTISYTNPLLFVHIKFRLLGMHQYFMLFSMTLLLTNLIDCVLFRIFCCLSTVEFCAYQCVWKNKLDFKHDCLWILLFFIRITNDEIYVLYCFSSRFLKGVSSLEERLLYKQEVGDSIPPCPNDIAMYF